jgi:2-methylcitrate dehydratase PrpD
MTTATEQTEAAAGVGVSRKLAAFAASLTYEMLTPEVIELTKQCIVDTLGVCTGASSLAPEGKIIYDFVSEMEGKPEASILGFGGKAPAAWAAFVNGGLGHMLDYDDVGGGTHVSIATIPVAFATAEKLGGVSGKEFLTAIAAGADVAARISAAVTLPDWTMTEGWFSTQLFGFIAGAATAGRLMHLDEDQMANAFGIAFNQLCGSRQMAVGEATHMRSMQAGFSGQGGVLAAELAQRGMTGPKDILEGRYGLFRTYVKFDNPDWDAVLAGLGTRFLVTESHAFKVWPSCAYTRPTNTAVLELRRRHNLQPDDIESIVVEGGTGGTKLLSEPIESKRRPQASIDAKYSVPFTTAIAMAKGNVTLKAYTPEGLQDPDVLRMADRVSYRPAPPTQLSKVPLIEIRTRGGELYSLRPDGLPGDSKHPVDRAFLEGKFRDCMSFAAKPVDPAAADRAIALVWGLEDAGDATEIIRHLT